MKYLTIILLFSLLACQRTSVPSNKSSVDVSQDSTLALPDQTYNCVNVPDSVLEVEYAEFGIQLSSSKTDTIKIPNDTNQINHALPDSVKIELYDPVYDLNGPFEFKINKVGKGLVVYGNTGKTNTLTKSHSLKILNLINKIIFVNRGHIIVAKRKIDGGLVMDRPQIVFKIYFSGKERIYNYDYIGREQEGKILTYSKPFIELWNMLDEEIGCLVRER